MFKINIINLHAAYSWHWTVNEELCGICQQSFDYMCSSCQHPGDCPPVLGKCEHTFHFHCLNLWLVTHTQCPMCREEWKIKKIYHFGHDKK